MTYIPTYIHTYDILWLPTFCLGEYSCKSPEIESKYEYKSVVLNTCPPTMRLNIFYLLEII